MIGSKRDEQKEKRRFDPELLKKGLRCDSDQYKFLEECSKKGEQGIKEWNQYRNDNRGVDIFLEGAYLNTCHLKGIHLESRGIRSLNKEEIKRTSGKTRSIVYLKGAHFTFAELQEAKFMLAVLSEAEFGGAKLQGAKFARAILHKADLENAELEGADFCYAELQGANFETAIVDGSTLIWKPKVNRYRKGKHFTDFSGVGLDQIRIDPGTKQLLEYNIRRMNWKEWYKVGPWWEKIPERLFVQPFWWMSNYGRSVSRIVACFFGLAVVFAFVYRLWPSCVMVDGIVGDIRGFVHALYFSVVTMTTLGFGDIAANPDSWQGQTLLMLQVVLGYVLLGALVTRFAVLFMAGGPAGKFANEKRKPQGTQRRE